jgi:hypothetical protein
MKLDNYINNLLYRYNCVIIPDFGGFVTNKISAKINKASNTFYPPAKQITFNSHLKVNDGLLANYIASSENISFEKAANIVAMSVLKWKNEIKTKPIQITAVGVLTLNESGQIIFEPTKKINYLTASFGLTDVQSESIKRNKTHVIPLIPVIEKEESKRIPTFIKYAATAAIFLTLTFIGNNAYQQDRQQKVLASQEKAIEKRIQSATFVIANPLPTLELNVAKKRVFEKKYHVVAGAFQFPENAMKKVNQLKEKGYNARILGVNKWGLIEVAFNSFADRNDAINSLYKIQDTVSIDAWLLIKK